MEKLQVANIPKATQQIAVTPDGLRQIADRLEHLARSVLPGHEITYEATRSVSLVYSPDMNTERFFRIACNIEETEQ